MIHKVGKFAIDVEADIGAAAAAAMQDCSILGSASLTNEARGLVGILFQICRLQLKAGSRPIALQQALRIAEEAMGDPDGMGIRK